MYSFCSGGCCTNYQMVNGACKGNKRWNSSFKSYQFQIFFSIKLNGCWSKYLEWFCLIACPVGYFGSNCGTPCTYPLFGHFCLLKCNCSQSKCDHMYGCKRDGKFIVF